MHHLNVIFIRNQWKNDTKPSPLQSKKGHFPTAWRKLSLRQTGQVAKSKLLVRSDLQDRPNAFKNMDPITDEELRMFTYLTQVATSTERKWDAEFSVSVQVKSFQLQIGIVKSSYMGWSSKMVDVSLPLRESMTIAYKKVNVIS